jgi:hypothetical protein
MVLKEADITGFKLLFLYMSGHKSGAFPTEPIFSKNCFPYSSHVDTILTVNKHGKKYLLHESLQYKMTKSIKSGRVYEWTHEHL